MRLFFILLFSIFLRHSFGQNLDIKSNNKKQFKVTFIELGSVRCADCKKMQVVMKSIETKYGNLVKVIFYDVFTPSGKLSAKQFFYQLIPTQIFLDVNGKEYYRHVGYFPEKDLVKILQQKVVR